MPSFVQSYFILSNVISPSSNSPTSWLLLTWKVMELVCSVEGDGVSLLRQINVTHMYSFFILFLGSLGGNPFGQAFLALPHLEVCTSGFLEVILLPFGNIIEQDTYRPVTGSSHADTPVVRHLYAAAQSKLHELGEVNVFARLINRAQLSSRFFAAL